MSEQRKYRTWTAQRKIEIVLAGLRGDRTVKDVCREHEISETLYYSWRDKLLEGGREALAGKDERNGERSCAGRSASSSGRSGGRPTSLRSLGKHCEAGSEGARRPVSRAGRTGFALAAVTRVLQVSRQAVYRTPAPPTRRPCGRARRRSPARRPPQR
jgi:transposase